MEAMTEPGSASKYNKLFPEKGQRVQRHKRSYSAAGGAPSLLGAGMRSRRGGGEGRCQSHQVLHISLILAGPHRLHPTKLGLQHAQL